MHPINAMWLNTRLYQIEPFWRARGAIRAPFCLVAPNAIWIFTTNFASSLKHMKIMDFRDISKVV